MDKPPVAPGDSCPVESHMRTSTCKQFGLQTPQCEAMVTDSCKMARYVGDLLGCQTALHNRDECLEAAAAGKLVQRPGSARPGDGIGAHAGCFE